MQKVVFVENEFQGYVIPVEKTVDGRGVLKAKPEVRYQIVS